MKSRVAAVNAAFFVRRAALWLGLMFLVLFLFGAMSAANGQGKCSTKQNVETWLSEKYGEKVVATGKSEDGLLKFQLWRNSQTQSFTWVTIFPNGLHCIIATGFKWKAKNPGQGI